MSISNTHITTLDKLTDVSSLLQKIKYFHKENKGVSSIGLVKLNFRIIGEHLTIKTLLLKTFDFNKTISNFIWGNVKEDCGVSTENVAEDFISFLEFRPKG